MTPDPQGEREISLHVDDEESGQSTPVSVVSHDPLTGEHVISNTVVVVQDKDPLGLVEVVAQHLESEAQPSEDSTAVTIDQEIDTTSAPVQDTTQMPDNAPNSTT